MASRNPLQPLLNQIPKPLRNKYFIVLAVFFFWMIFIDKHDFLTQWRLQRAVDQMREEKELYIEKIDQAKQDRLDLEANKEKFAREQYFMKKRDEEVFIIEDEE